MEACPVGKKKNYTRKITYSEKEGNGKAKKLKNKFSRGEKKNGRGREGEFAKKR